MDGLAPNDALVAPEVMLDRLNHDLLRLRAAVAYLNEPSLTDQVTGLLRRTLVTSLLHQRYGVAVVGAQSTGKTTLVRNLFGLSEADLPANVGLGERIPLRFRATGESGQVRRYIQAVAPAAPERPTDPSIKQVDVDPLDPHQWSDAVEGRRADALLAEMEVGVPTGLSASQDFLLLPGYERLRKHADPAMDNRMRQALMRQALAASAIAIVTVDRPRLANRVQDDIVADLDEWLTNRNHIIVITMAEGTDSAHREELSRTAADVFRVPTAEIASRILFADYENLEAFRSRIQRAIDVNSEIRREQRSDQLTALSTLLSRDLAAVLRAIEDRQARVEVGGSDEEAAVSAVLTRFDDAVRRVRRDHDKMLEAALTDHLSKASKVAKDFHADDIEGLTRLHIRLWRAVSDSAGDSEERYLKTVRLGWSRGHNDHNGFSPRYTGVLGDVVGRRLRIQAPDIATDATAGPRALPAQPSSVDEPDEADEVRFALPASVAGDLEVIRTMNADVVMRPSQDWGKAIDLMPVLALEMMRVAQEQPDIVSVDPKTLEPIHSDPTQIAQTVATAWATWVPVQRGLIISAASALGLDALAGGQVTNLHELANALGQAASGVAPTAMASGVATAASATVMTIGTTIAAGALVVIAANAIKRDDLRQRQFIDATLAAVRDATQDHYQTGFDDLMDTMRQVLEARLRDWFHLDETFMRDNWLKKVLSDCRSHSLALQEAIDGNIASLG